MKAPRKLTTTETSTLRTLLLSQLDTSTPQSEEDAGDLLDYAFAMINNGKEVEYVVDEVRFVDVWFDVYSWLMFMQMR